MKHFPRRWLGLLLFLTLTGSWLTGSAQAGSVQAREGTLRLPTYPWWPALPHPYFRETDSKNIYPYPMLDNLSREKVERAYRTVELENDYLRVTFLPELGGKIQEVLDKTTGQQMFYVNHVIKPGLIGMCGAWTSGGVEWNTGPQGHTVSAMQPVDVLILPPEKDGSQSVAIGETERIYGTKWTVVVTLRPGRAFLEERIRIYNPTERVRPYYFWNCTAVPNTPGFRFIYPMTLGCDHGAEKFFDWPMDHGKDLTRGTNYQDASSIFAWYCDQDFFGSYDDGADRGVVSFANHHQVPGKKAWTWGQGGFGRMHQMDLTDNDGPYNEVQTGPLLTQGEVGRLEPCEAVEWQEWWYPVHGLGGFTFANRDLAVNASREGDKLQLRLMGTASWRKAIVQVRGAQSDSSRAECALSPNQPASVILNVAGRPQTEVPEVEILAGDRLLARFKVPLQLPTRTRPEKKPAPETSAELARAGWDHYLFARLKEAESSFRAALGKDPRCVTAQAGLAMLLIDRDPTAARKQAATALVTDPDCGLAHFTLAAASLPEDETSALDHAWQASLDPSTAVAGRALVGRILIARNQFQDAIAALSGPGPWQSDLVCRDRRALALCLLGRRQAAAQLARTSLETDPLDGFASSVLWLADASSEGQRLDQLLARNPNAVTQLASAYWELKQNATALRIIEEFYLNVVPVTSRDPLVDYWANYLRRQTGRPTSPSTAAAPSVFPFGQGSLTVLRDTVSAQPNEGVASLLLGHVLFQLGRYGEGQQAWQRAADLSASPVVAYRALGMASLTLDNNPALAAEQLARAHAADPKDCIVARDLARVLLAQADKSDSPDQKSLLWAKARDTLQTAFSTGRGRSDFVCLLGRAQNKLGEYAKTAQMLDRVRITVWEGSREAHDLFEEAHLALGKALLKEGRPADALIEFDRALEYPENLATGKLENARESHIHKLRAEALTALGRTDEARKASEHP